MILLLCCCAGGSGGKSYPRGYGPAGQPPGYGPRRRDRMMVGGHWIQGGGYSHTPATLPTYDYSGYYQSVPTPATA